MSRRDRIIEDLERENEYLRARNRMDRKHLNDLRAQHPECPSCAVFAFDLDLARETIEALAAERGER